jgi:hypothetical protein
MDSHDVRDICRAPRSRRWRYAHATVLAATVASTLGCFAGFAPAALPEGREYEMVSPPYKAGYPVLQPGRADFYVAPSGEGVVFSSLGAFDLAGSDQGGDAYLARRGDEGWKTSAVVMPAGNGTIPLGEEYSADLTESLSRAFVARNNDALEEATTEALYLRDLRGPESSFVQASPLLKALSGGPVSAILSGASVDLSHAVLAVTGDGPKVRLLPDDTMEEDEALYEVAGVGGLVPVLRLVGVNNEGGVIDPHCDITLAGGSKFHAISSDGSEIFFTGNVNPAEGKACDLLGSPGGHPNNPAELYVRINGSKTLEISKPLSESCTEVPCPGAKERATAVFQGASENGARVFFTTSQSLVNGDKDTANDLYMAVIENEAVKELVQVSHDSSAGETASVEGVVRISPDGSHVYFVARGMLAGQNSEGSSPAPGADNLYVYDTANDQTTFVAALCSGPSASGASTDTRCGANLNSLDARHSPGAVNDSVLWGTEDAGSEAQVNGCQPAEASCEAGRFLVFSTYAQLTPDDVDTARDVYEYDAQTGRLVRVSVGEGGHDDNGNRDGVDASIAQPEFNTAAVGPQYQMNTRAVSDDGSTIVFTTSEPLSASAVNNRPDIYVWHDGQVGLISSGLSPEPGEAPVISPSGHDIFFRTAESLVPQDTDGLGDIYDARIGGGFPATHALPAACSADTCQGPLSAAPSSPLPGSVSQAGGGNLPPAPAVTTKAKKKAKRAKKKVKKKATRARRAQRSVGKRKR